jgi:hypothetical protein
MKFCFIVYAICIALYFTKLSSEQIGEQKCLVDLGLRADTSKEIWKTFFLHSYDMN